MKFSPYPSREDPMIIKTSPVGLSSPAVLEKVTSNIDEFRKAIIHIMGGVMSMNVHGFVHCDVSWNNITYDEINESYLLFDFECIAPIENYGLIFKQEDLIYAKNANLDAKKIIQLFYNRDLKDILSIDIEKEYKYVFDLAKTLIDGTTGEGQQAQIWSVFWKFYKENG